MDDWNPPHKPAQLCESRLISAILDGTFPINSSLPAERELAARLGVTRPTLREVLTRLDRAGWIEIHHGKPTRVRDYWREGNLMVLAALAQAARQLPPHFSDYMLEVRTLFAPAYTRKALERDRQAVIALLQNYPQLPDDAVSFARADWQLQYELTLLSGNPVFTLIYNSFTDLYESLAVRYFSIAENRAHSRAFYLDLLGCAERCDGNAAEELVRQTMQSSRERWKQQES
ncbi:MAG TPA: fatty acid metabolism transcriptional regulator FadR [Anaerolineaceae bacterium]|jgi:GntR family negative regulator for fad regulon and positive regulator of fabA|nr:fatty acid metabolism transcriptional regulator FadR [Longilinea sp.]NMD30486.1 fatty acid metabolism transcriptional regulator FadR [Chloroflexota bacterium]HPA33604.1 fatty acid metabolism transcriptional regulator FadR [Anaerolineaceae bacterium]HQF44832.1 fatty acid metabolism transcriptional regulator FadR [Anaerolineaceae bacterium]HQH34599.1 fatty acid metabolism transcriptional regulator FadR [Anaerolineaceae bacterium]